MASEPKKDSASETALRAVEDALNIEFTDEDNLSASRGADGDTDPDFGELEQRLAEAANDLRQQSAEADARSQKPTGARATPRRARPSERLASTADLAPANDMVNVGVSDIAYSLNAKPSSRVFWVAALLSIGWVGIIGGAYLYARNNGALEGLFGNGNFLTGPLPWLAIGFIGIPVLLIWAFAVMVRRAQEMRTAAQTMAEAAIRLLRPEDTAAGSVASVGRAIRREVAAINEGMERAIARAGELEQFVQSEVGNLERSYADAEVRLKGLVGELSSERNEIVGHVDMLRDSLADTHTGITTEVDLVAQRVEAAVQATTSRIVDSIDTEGLAVTGKLEEVTNRLTDMLSERSTLITTSVAQRASDFDQLIQARVAELDNTVESRLTGFGSALDTRIDGMFQKLDKQQTGVEEATTRIERIVDEQIANAGKEIGAQGMELVKAIGSQTTALDKVLTDRTVKIGAVIGERLSQFGAGVTQHVDSAVARVEERGGLLESTAQRIEQAIEDNVQRFDETLRERALEVARSFTSGRDVISGLLDEAMESVSSKALEAKLGLEGVNSDMISAIDERINTITSTLSESHHRLTSELDKMDDRSTGLASEIDLRTERMSELVENASNRLSSIMDQRTDAFHGSLAEGHNLLASSLNEGHNRLASSLTESHNRLASSLTEGQDRLADLLEKMETRSGVLVNEIDQRNAALLGEIDHHVERVGSSFQQASGDLSATLESGVSLLRENIGEGQQAIFAEIENLNAGGAKLVEDIAAKTLLLGESLASASNHIGAVVDEKNKSIFSTLRQSRDEFISEFDKTSREMFIDLEAKRTEIAASLTDQIEMTGRQIDSKAEALSNLLTERAHAINTSLGAELSETQALLENRTREFSNALAERAKELNTIIDERGMPIVEDLRGNTAELIDQIERVGADLSNGFSDLYERVTATTTKLDSMSTRAAETINQIDKNINESAESLSQSVEKAGLDSENSRVAAEHTAKSVSETTEYLLNNLAGNSLRFEKQTKELRDASSSVTEAQKQLAAVLEARQEPLERLAADISERSSAIEASVINFSGVLSGLFQDISEKANSAGKHVTHEIAKSFDQALERLAETVEGMRVASEEIRGELESTRTQMRRGIMEMPVEVKESSDSMRRVLVDQISALKELSEIVTKSGKAYDVAPPVTQPRLAASGGNTMHHAVPANNPGNRPVHLEAVRETGRAPAPDMVGGAAPRGPREVESSQPRSFADSGASSRQPAGRGHDQSHDAADEADSPQRSAIRDLLRRREPAAGPAGEAPQAPPSGSPSRARESNQRQPQNATDSLNSLSMDIARAIDHDTAVSVWERYQRGERKVFTRHLYTLQGQKTFDEIRAKYSREPEFRAAVDRYIGDFEKLLKDVRRNDRDNVMTQTYLTSDTGKVYTMLAHAAGRLGDG